MKIPSTLYFTIALLSSLALPARSQIEGPPGLIDYQGRVLDSVGNPVAEAAPENIEMYFRIWDHISESQPGNLLWAEKQIVTVSNGDFSVRLGEGDEIESSAGDNVISPGNDDPRPSLLTVFDGDERFLGVSVAENSLTKPQTEILPRLAFLMAPFSAVAEKARFAEFGPLGGIFSADQIGVGTTSPSAKLLEADTDNTGGAHQPTLTFSQDGGSQQTKLGYFGGTDDFGVELNGVRRLHIGADGNIGMGNSSPAGALHVTRADNDMARIYATGSSSGGGMFYAGQSAAFGGGFLYEGDSTPAAPGGVDRTVFFRRNSGTDSEVFSYAWNSDHVYFTGRIGVGTSSPSDSVTVSAGNVRLVNGSVEMAAGATTGLQWWFNGALFPYAQLFHGSDNRLYVRNLSGGVYMEPSETFWRSNSDERLKSDIEPLTGILEKIEDIRVVGYNIAAVRTDPETGQTVIDREREPRKTKLGKTTKHEIGTIAQDWLEHFPELVSEPADEDGYHGLAYSRIGIVAIGAAQELSRKVKEHESMIRERDAKIADLEARLAKLESLISQPPRNPPAERK